MTRINYAKSEIVVRDGREWTEIPATAYGDYLGSSVERSNCESLIKTFTDETERFWISDWNNDSVLLHGGETEAIQILPTTKIIIVDSEYCGRTLYGLADDEEIQNIISALSDYPVYDDHHLAHLEYTIHAEYVQDIINDVLNSHADEMVSEEMLCDMFNAVWDFLSDNNIEIIIETGCIPYCRERHEIENMLIEEFFTPEE